jgi:hypothetical protein
MMLKRGQGITFLLMLGTAAPTVFADDRCYSGATTDLERVYCEVVAEGGGAGLPSQPDFNRNDPQVQALLLKRPAQRLGLTVPQPGQPQPPTAASTNVQPDVNSEPSEPEESVEPVTSRGLANCELAGERIRCPQTDYNLAENQNRASLAEGVLGPDNRFRVESFEGDRKDEEAVRRYLSNAYDQYIPKMLRIGLGANTMSFTAFHNAFHTLENGGVDFAERMAETYQLLKQDRQQLGVKTRYHDDLPDSLSLCGVINRNIIVCDNVGTNWVYVRTDDGR